MGWIVTAAAVARRVDGPPTPVWARFREQPHPSRGRSWSPSGGRMVPHLRLRGVLAWSLLGAVGPLLLACGGSGPHVTTVTLPAVAALDGQTSSTGSASPGAALVVGDFSSNASARGHLRFDHSAIPTNAQVVAATLEVFQTVVTATPYADLGNVLVDHVDLGASLDAADHASPALLDSFGTLSTSPVLEGKTLDVTARVRADREAGRTTSDFRLHFAVPTDNDGVQELVIFNDTENNSGTLAQRPRLTLTYAQ